MDKPQALLGLRAVFILEQFPKRGKPGRRALSAPRPGGFSGSLTDIVGERGPFNKYWGGSRAFPGEAKGPPAAPYEALLES